MIELPVAVGSVGLTAAFGWTASWATSPLRQLAKKRALPVRISRADFLCLVSFAHLSWIVFCGLIGTSSLKLLGIVYLLNWFGWSILWADTVATLSRAGVTKTKVRAVLLTSIPTVLAFGVLGQVAAFLVLLDSSPEAALGIEAATILLVYGYGLFMRWLTNGRGVAETKAAQSPSQDSRETFDCSVGQITRDAIAWDIMLLSIPLKAMACVMEPIERAAKERHKPAQFTIADLLCLFLLVHGSSAVAYYLSSSLPKEVKTAEYIFGWIVWGALWWVNVRKLSQAGVTSPRHRVVFLLLIVPWFVVGSFLQVGAWMCLLSGVSYLSHQAAMGYLLVAVALGTVLAAIFYACAWYTYRIVAIAGDEKRTVNLNSPEDHETAG